MDELESALTPPDFDTGSTYLASASCLKNRLTDSVFEPVQDRVSDRKTKWG
jgi:hypothetical protein